MQRVLGAAAPLKPTAFSSRSYCASFFLSLAVALVTLRKLDVFLERAGGSNGPPLLQPIWAWALRHGWWTEHIGFGAMVAFASYIVSCLYFTYFDLTRSFATKIQKQYFPTLREMIVAGLPQIAIYAGANWMWYTYGYERIELPAQAPRLAVFAEQLLVAFVVGDFLIYWEHRVMHMFRFLRVHIHSWHHAYTAPFGWAGGVVHPLEDMVVVVCQTTAPVLLAHHPLSFWTFVALWTALLIEEHSGHDVIWAPYNWMPFARCPMGGGAAPHDIHHYKVTKNFAFCLCVWDHLFGTFEPVREVPDLPAHLRAKSS